MSTALPTHIAFESAVKDFFGGLTHKDDYDFSKFRSIDDVYDETDRIQKNQGNEGALRNLNKIQPYLRRISEYSGVIDTFVQVKPDILAFLWGPIKLLLQVSSTYVKSFDKLLEVMTQLAEALPQFSVYADLFRQKSRISHVLCLFYRDILDFYTINLNFFKLKGWKVFFESLWPRYGEKILVIQNNITRHRALFDSEVTLGNISDAYEARFRALKEYEENRKFREQQQFEAVKVSLAPRLYYDELEAVVESCCRGTGGWILNKALVQDWSDPNKDTVPLLWLSGMPGAGKTHLSATIIQHMIGKRHNIVFTFLDYKNSETTKRIEIFRSFIFQLLQDHEALRAAVQIEYDTNYRRLSSSLEFVRNLFQNLIGCIGITYIVVDGLDEISRGERQQLLKTLIELCDSCSKVRLLISSRKESDISKMLCHKAKSLTVDLENTPDIKSYVDYMVKEWLDTTDISPSSSVAYEIKNLVDSIAAKSEGMFLYARLVMVNLTNQPNIRCFKKEAKNLPNGLNEAYGRIITRIELAEARTILKWIACSEVTLRKQELEQALMIQASTKRFDYEEKTFQDLVQLCGPIIEIHGEYVNFVHFTAKEYLCGHQSEFFIREAAAHREIAMTCMTYLKFDYFDPDITDAMIDKFVLDGHYILLLYAESYWLEHIKQGLRESSGSPSFDDLCSMVHIYLGQQTQSEIEYPDKGNPKLIRDLLPIRERWPVIYDSLSAINDSYTQNQRELQSINDFLPGNEEFEQLLQLCRRIQVRFESLGCLSAKHRQDCHCSNLQMHYGTLMFKCNKRSCKFFRIGFTSRVQRDNHVKHHERRFKCSQPNCDFLTLGFISQVQLNHHLAACHPKNEHMKGPEMDLLNLPHLDAENVLLDAVKMGHGTYLKTLLGAAKPRIQESPEIVNQLLCTALQGTSRETVEILFAAADKDSFLSGLHSDGKNDPFYWAALGNSLEIAEFLISKGMRPGQVKSGKSALVQALRPGQVKSGKSALVQASQNSHLEMVQLLLQYNPDWDMDAALQSLISKGSSSSADLDIAQLLIEHGADLRQTYLRPECSIELAAFLLEKGLDVNYFRGGGYTFLYYAVRRNNRKGLEFAKFLLENGADPTLGSGSKKLLPGNLAWASTCPQILGMTWDELVASTWGSRQTQRTRTPTPSAPTSPLPPTLTAVNPNAFTHGYSGTLATTSQETEIPSVQAAEEDVAKGCSMPTALIWSRPKHQKDGRRTPPLGNKSMRH